MHPADEAIQRSRRSFLTSTASGIGLVALASLLREQGLLAGESGEPASRSFQAANDPAVNPLAIRPPHFAPRAQRCICIFLEGGPSQVDLFDPKPKLNELNGQQLPESLTKNMRFAFIQKDSAMLMASPRRFARYGQSGMEFSELLPHIATCADEISMVRSMYTDQFNHHPGQLLMNSGIPRFGNPSMGAWLNYGLGSVNQNLPGYVVLSSGRGTSGGASNWSSGFLPSSFQGVTFRSSGEPVLNLATPPGVPSKLQKETIDVVSELNGEHAQDTGDTEIQSRIASLELAFRMQSSAPGLVNFSDESRQTLVNYGVTREDPPVKADRHGGPNQFRSFSANCLLARRLIEQGVRFVNLYHASWDHHSNLNTELAFNSRMADQPIAALLKDLKDRGLLDTTLVIWMSEFGRTPLGENRPSAEITGRDHHPLAFTMWMAGGGVKPGYVLGQTDEIGWNVVEDPVHVHDLHATILHLFGLDHLKLTYRYKGLNVRLTDQSGKVVDKLLA